MTTPPPSNTFLSLPPRKEKYRDIQRERMYSEVNERWGAEVEAGDEDRAMLSTSDLEKGSPDTTTTTTTKENSLYLAPQEDEQCKHMYRFWTRGEETDGGVWNRKEVDESTSSAEKKAPEELTIQDKSEKKVKQNSSSGILGN